MKTYRVIVTSQAPFCDPVEWPYGPPQPDRFKALLSLGAALQAHDADDDHWTGLQSVRIDVTEESHDADSVDHEILRLAGECVECRNLPTGDARDAEADSCTDPDSCTEASHV